ncbi:MAG: Crp/Fnr family transcriptional regulator [Methylobacterium sp.]|uniref:Crp/Fnr family transcriptional regulator n=1 Tax=Methylobacterium sp. TaxID=409 RepID=UPI0026013F84|nr:Crp/Fnr family transcriptional regulator [Methylobacterium sp.]MBX9934154.1 Crp/Fnr family transcriptional regulator [Methylobacterium sp.]
MESSQGTRPLLNAALLGAVIREKKAAPQKDIVRQGQIPQVAHLLMAGHTCRYRMLGDGSRQITAILVPGDICDLEAALGGRANYGVAALTHCTVGEIPLHMIANPAANDHGIAEAIWSNLLRDEAIAREWMVGLGRRPALQRMAHLFCELRVRLRHVGLAIDDAFDMRVTQSELADVLGLSYVHVNRVLQELRRGGLIRMSGGVLAILDVARLEQMADFDPSYLRSTFSRAA